MGIKNLGKAIREFAPRAVRATTLDAYRGLTFAIDAPIQMHRFKYTAAANAAANDDQPDDAANPVARLFEEQVALLRAHDIRPVYVFDGRAPVAKAAEVERRRQERHKATEAMGEARAAAQLTQSRGLCSMGADPLGAIVAAEEELRRAERRVASQPVSADYAAVRRRLAALGVPVRQAAADGEAECADCVRLGLADVVVSEDLDSLPYGATRLLTKLGQQQGRELVEYDLRVVLEQTGFTHATFVDWCILCGSDLCSSIRGVAYKRAYALLQAHASIEGVLEHLPAAYTVPEEFDFARARAEFLRVGAATREEQEE